MPCPAVSRVRGAARARRLHGPEPRVLRLLSPSLEVDSSRKAEEREQRLRVEEERELDDPAVLDLEHLQRPRIEARPALARLVLAERRRAVRGEGRDHLRAAAAAARADP